MEQHKILVKVIDVIYFIGVLIVVYHLGLALFAGSTVPYPDSMLSGTYYEIVSWRLAFGAIPMTLASIAFWYGNGLRRSEHRARNCMLTFLPAAICLLCMVFYVVIVVLGMLTFYERVIR